MAPTEVTGLSGTTDLDDSVDTGEPGEIAADEMFVDEMLVEEISIDGMCGVY